MQHGLDTTLISFRNLKFKARRVTTPEGGLTGRVPALRLPFPYCRAALFGALECAQLQQEIETGLDWKASNFVDQREEAVHPAQEELALGRRNMTSLLILMMFATQGTANDSQRTHALVDVHNIYVDSMGHDDEAVRFRSLLKQELTRAGFTVEDDAAKADAVLGGTFSVRVVAGYSRSYADVALRESDGATIWQGDFGPRFWRGRKGGDDVKNCAGDIADKLLKDSKQTTAHR
jgi:hypothetical protein